MKEERPLSTWDFTTNLPEDVRGHRDEAIESRDRAVMDRPSADAAERDRQRASAEGAVERNTPAQAVQPATEAPQRPADRAPLFSEHDAADLRTRWADIQAAFVDEPRRAVERADSLVAEVMKRLAESFANERAGLERQWDRGDNVTTEDLRVALQRYRSFFDRLLAV